MQEQQQIIFSAGLGVCAGHVEAAERMCADQRAGALTVQVQISDVERFFSLPDFFRILRIDRTGQTKFRIVGDFQRFGIVLCFDDREHRTKHLLLSQPRFRRNIRDNRRLDEIAVAWRALSAGEQASFFFAYFDVIQNRLHRRLVDHRPHVIVGIIAGTNGDFLGALNQLLQERVVNFLGDDRARACGTLLALIAKRRLNRSFHGRINIRFLVHDNGILAAHFQHRALDPDLTWRGLRCQFANAKSNFFRACKSDVARLRMRHQSVANGAARSGDEVHCFLRNPRLKKNVNEFRRDGRGIARRLQNYSVAGNERGHNESRHDGAGEIPRRNDHADAQRNIHQIVALSAHRRQLLGLGQSEHFAAIEFTEIDRLCDVRVRFHPRFSHFVANQRSQLKFSLAHDLRRAEEAFHALLSRHFFPGVEIFIGRLNGLLGHVRRGVLEDADHFRWARWIRGIALFRCRYPLPGKPHRVFAAEFGFHFFQSFFHALAVLWFGEINERLVGELGYVRFLFGGGHGDSPLSKNK